MSDHIPWALIAKYLAGECSQDEKLAMEWWLEDIDNEILFQQIETAWQKQLNFDCREEFNPEEGIDKLNARIFETEESGKDTLAEKKQYNRVFPLLIAASVLFLIGFAYLFLGRQMVGLQIQPIVSIQKVSGNDQILTFLLPDGSKVWLNKNSRLIFPAQFNKIERTVFLEGEAFFEVIPDAGSPFVVRSNKVSTKVLGTSFNVKAYKTDEISSVTVATGKVEVSKEIARGNPTRITQLMPRQELVINTEKGETFIDIVSASSIGTWRKNLLVFQNNTYAEVISRLEDSFDVEIRLANKEFGQCRLMASFNENASLDDVLKLLSISNQFSYSIDGKQVIIRGGVCK